MGRRAALCGAKIEPASSATTEPLLHPGKAARTGEGWVGELHPSLLDGVWGAFELDLDALVARAPAAVEFEEVSPYPEVRQDLAFVVDDDVPAAELLAAMREAGGAGAAVGVRSSTSTAASRSAPGKNSLAFRVAFGSPERTLTDEEAASVREPDRRGARRRGSAPCCAREQSDPARSPVSAAWGSGSCSQRPWSRFSVPPAARAPTTRCSTGDVGAERRVHDHAERRGGRQGDAPRRRARTR